MKAVLWVRYGPSENLQVKEVDKPELTDDKILVRVYAATVNRTDFATIMAKPFFMRIITGLFRPKKHIPGSAFAGKIEALGKAVNNRVDSNFSPLTVGEKVFGFDDEVAGAHAQYLTCDQEHLIRMPANVSYSQAAACIEGFHYAYNFINKVTLKKVQQVLVNGASGAIGSAAVQLLKYYGINVTAVCGPRNLALVKTLGADKVIDYTQENFTHSECQYDMVFDTVGKSSFFKCWKILKPGGIYISSDLGYLAQNIFLPLVTALIKSLLRHKHTLFPVPEDIKASLRLAKQLLEQGHFKPLIDRNYSLEDIVEAYKYVGNGHKTGNVVVTIENA